MILRGSLPVKCWDGRLRGSSRKKRWTHFERLSTHAATSSAKAAG
jgi:hypothetical protein